MVELLTSVPYGIDIDAKESYYRGGQTALHYAVSKGDVVMIQILLNAGANIDVLSFVGGRGRTALVFAIEK